MANLCQQCSLELFNHDDQNLAFIGGLAPTHKEDQGYEVMCESCGPILVDDYGVCLVNCFLNHNGGEQNAKSQTLAHNEANGQKIQ